MAKAKFVQVQKVQTDFIGLLMIVAVFADSATLKNSQIKAL